MTFVDGAYLHQFKVLNTNTKSPAITDTYTYSWRAHMGSQWDERTPTIRRPSFSKESTKPLSCSGHTIRDHTIIIYKQMKKEIMRLGGILNPRLGDQLQLTFERTLFGGMGWSSGFHKWLNIFIWWRLCAHILIEGGLMGVKFLIKVYRRCYPTRWAARIFHTLTECHKSEIEWAVWKLFNVPKRTEHFEHLWEPVLTRRHQVGSPSWPIELANLLSQPDARRYLQPEVN